MTRGAQETYDIFVSKNGVVTDVIAALKPKVALEDCSAANVRLYEVHGSKIYKVLNPESTVASINEYVSLYAEKIPDDELHTIEKTTFINAFHFNKEPSRAHGVPFRFIVKQVSRLSHGCG